VYNSFPENPLKENKINKYSVVFFLGTVKMWKSPEVPLNADKTEEKSLWKSCAEIVYKMWIIRIFSLSTFYRQDLHTVMWMFSWPD
jgi:hypothetical protein